MSEDTTPTGVSSADDALATALGVPEETNVSNEPTEPEPETEEVETGAEEQPEADEGEEDDETRTVENLEDLADALGTTVDDLLTIQAKTKIDGEDGSTTLGDLLKSYQLEGHVNRKSQELSDQRKAFETEQKQVQEAWKQRMQLADQMAGAQEQELQRQYQSIDWASLQRDDPAQYSALYLQFQQAANNLQAQKQAITQRMQEAVTQHRAEMKPKALQQIHASHPDLADEAHYANAVASIRKDLQTRGFADSDMEALELDPRIFGLARDAMRYRTLADKKPDISQRVKKAPKFEKPSSRASENTQAKSLRDRAVKGDGDALAQLLAH